MELRHYAQLLRQRLLLVILTVVAGAAGGYLITHRTPRYQSHTTVFVGAEQLTQGTSSGAGVAAMDRITQTYAAMIRSEPVAQAAIQSSHAARSAATVVAETTSVVLTNTNLISIVVTDRDPHVAQGLAGGIAQGFVSRVLTLNTGVSPNLSTASVFQAATPPTGPLSTGLKRNLVLGTLFGLAASIAVVLLLDYVDVSVRNAEDLAPTGLPVLGTIPFRRRPVIPRGRPVTAANAHE